MTELAIAACGDGRFTVSGDLTFASIDKRALRSMGFLRSAKEVTLDMGQVGLADSAGLALMIEWARQARDLRCRLSFVNIPAQLANLAKLSGLELTGAWPGLAVGDADDIQTP